MPGDLLWPRAAENYRDVRVRSGGKTGFQGDAPWRHLVDHAYIEITVDRQSQTARNGRGAHDKQMWLAGGFIPQHTALLHTKAMLFIHHHKSQVAKFNLLLNQRSCTDDNINATPT